MNIKALITALGIVVGSSSAAMAKPLVTVQANAEASWHVTAGTRGPVVRDHRDNQPTYQQPHRTRSWFRPNIEHYQNRAMLFADGLTFSIKGTRQDIVVGADKGAFRSINISGAGGRTYITHARIDFMDGSYQVTRGLDRTLAGSQSMSLDLDGNARQIKRIVVYGQTNGAFTISGNR